MVYDATTSSCGINEPKMPKTIIGVAKPSSYYFVVKTLEL